MNRPAPAAAAGPSPVPWIFADRWLQAALAVTVLGWLVVMWSVLCTATSPGVPWNAARLAPAFALAQGLPIYPLRDSGQQLGWFYGPGFPLWNLPATLTGNVTRALWIAAVWNVLTWLVPMALVLRVAGVALGGWRLGAAAAIAGVLLVGGSATNYAFYFIHVDALCVGAGLVAIIGLHRAIGTGRRGWLHLVAGGLIVAIWTKQIGVILAPALFWHLWRERQWALAWPLCFLCAVYAAISSVAVFLWFGAPEVLYNLWLTHSRNPSRGDLLFLVKETARLVGTLWVWLPLGLIALVAWRKSPGQSSAPAASGGLVRLLLRAAAWQLPMGLLALTKAGGGFNSVYAVYYLLLVLLIVGLSPGMRPQLTAVHRVAWVLAWWLPLGQALVFAAGPGSQWRVSHRNEELVAMARAEPGRYYFPWNPLVTLIAEKKIQPLDDALYCLWLMKLEPPVEKIRAAVPARPIILYEEPAQSHFALRYFPEIKPQP